MALIPGNLLDLNTQSLETSASDWSVLTNCTIAQSTTQAHDGTHSLAITSSASGAANVIINTGTVAFPPVTPGNTYQFYFWAYTTSSGISMQSGGDFYNGTTFVSSYSPTPVTLTANAWTFVQVTGTAPATSTLLRPIPQFTATAAGQIVYIDTIYFGTPFTVTSTGSAGTGILLQVQALTGATEAGGTSGSVNGTGTPDASLTPSGSNSLFCFGLEFTGSGGTFTLDASNTAWNNASDTVNGARWGNGFYSGTVTAGTPVTVGASAPTSSVFAGYEVLASGSSTPAVDASSPSVVSATGTGSAAAGVTTSTIAPPEGAVLVAMTSIYASTGAPSVSVSDSIGLTWTQRASGAGSGSGSTAVWTATYSATAGNSVSLVGSVGVGSRTTSGTTLTGVYGQTPTANNLLVAAVVHGGTTAAAWSTSQHTGTSGWTEFTTPGAVGNNASGNDQAGVDFWYKVAAGGDAAPVFDVTIAGTEAGIVLIYELSGADTSSPFDTSGVYQSGGTSLTIASQTATTSANVSLNGSFAIAATCVERSTAASRTYANGGGSWVNDYSGDAGTSTSVHLAADHISGVASGAALTATFGWQSRNSSFEGASVIVIKPTSTTTYNRSLTTSATAAASFGGTKTAFRSLTFSATAALTATPSDSFHDDFSSYSSRNTCLADTTTFGPWEVLWGSTADGGCTQLTGPDSYSSVLQQTPATATSSGQTFSAVTPGPSYSGSYSFSTMMRTVSQLRTGSSPNNWETAWVFWDFTYPHPGGSSTDCYYYIIKESGTELGRLNNGVQTILATTSNNLDPSKWHNVYVVHTVTSATALTVYIDGSSTADITYTDSSASALTSGQLACYCEDSQVHFTNWDYPGVNVAPIQTFNRTLTTAATAAATFGGTKTALPALTPAATVHAVFAGTVTKFRTLTTAATAQASFTRTRTTFGAVTAGATAQASFRAVHPGHLTTTATAATAFAGTRTQFRIFSPGATAQAAFAGARTEFGTLTSAATAHAVFAGTKTVFPVLSPVATVHAVFTRTRGTFGAVTAAATAQASLRAIHPGHLTTTATAAMTATGHTPGTGQLTAAVTAQAAFTRTRIAFRGFTSSVTAGASFSAVHPGHFTPAATAQASFTRLRTAFRSLTTTAAAAAVFGGTKTAVVSLNPAATAAASFTGTKTGSGFGAVTPQATAQALFRAVHPGHFISAATAQAVISTVRIQSGALTALVKAQDSFSGTPVKFRSFSAAVTAQAHVTAIRTQLGNFTALAGAAAVFAGVKTGLGVLSTVITAQSVFTVQRVVNGSLTASVTAQMAARGVLPQLIPLYLSGTVEIISFKGQPVLENLRAIILNANKMGGYVIRPAVRGGSAVIQYTAGTVKFPQDLRAVVTRPAVFGGTISPVKE